tara:strand:+ start:1761 stop:1991 length:231 start_codon:yes stop_codon:yes gene_type:complete
MKENKLIEMSNKVKALINVTQHLLNETAHIKELAVGTLEVIKNMPDYNEAMENLKKQVLEEPSKEQKAETSGKTIE